MRKTKIICTIGPSSNDADILLKMIQGGMNVARFNFSHGSYEEHKTRIETVRQAARLAKQTVAIMLDTKGAEIRTGLLQDHQVMLEAGQTFILTTRNITGNQQEVEISYKDLVRQLQPGNIILLSDGLIHLQVEELSTEDIICKVIHGGVLGEKKGVNIPGVRIDLPFLTEKDEEDILFGIGNDVDFIAASFVRDALDVLQIKRILEHNNADIGIVAKIESQEGVNNISRIIKVADGVMVARGDLGVEIPFEEVPLVQKKLIEKCGQAGKMVIIATQMLDSMMNSPRPTRAEVSDVAHAIFDGADAIMLSGETAGGKYPLESVIAMDKIARKAQEVLPYQEMLHRRRMQGKESITDAISYATCATAMNLGVSAIISSTRSGHTARMVAKYRPQTNIVAVTPSEKVLQKLALVWGVNPVLAKQTQATDDLLSEAVRVTLKQGYIENGDVVILTAGIPASSSGETNFMKVHVVSEILVQGMGIGEAICGRVKIILQAQDLHQVEAGDILVVKGIDRNFVPIFDQIGALVSEEEGLTSDSAIMALNARKPVIVGAKNATAIMKEGSMVTLDTPRGRIYEGITKII